MPFPLLSTFQQEAKLLQVSDETSDFTEFDDGEKIAGTAFFGCNGTYPQARIIGKGETLPEQIDFAITKSEKGWGVFWKIDKGISEPKQGIKAKALYLHADGRSLKKSLEAVSKKALEATGGKGRLLNEKLPLPKWLFKLGWSTSAIDGCDYTHDAVMNAVWSLKQQGALPCYVILKEGWQHFEKTLDSEKLLDFEADPVRFPGGLKSLVNELKAAGVFRVGVSHYLEGGRLGLSEGLKKRYALSKESTESDEIGKAFQFYHDYYNFLHHAGVSFVEISGEKCSKESAQMLLKGQLYLAAQGAAALHFDSPPILGEATASSNLYFCPLARQALFSHAPLKSSVKNLYQMLWQYCLNSELFSCLMEPFPFPFSTREPGALSSAILTALASRGCHLCDLSSPDKALLMKTVMPSGKTFKGDEPLRICPESLTIDPFKDPVPFKVYTSKSGVRVMGIFNWTDPARGVTFPLTPLDIPSPVGDRFAVSSQRLGFLGTLTLQESFEYTLESGMADTIIFAPIKGKVAVIGFSTHFFAPGPIYEIDSEEQELHISSKMSGPLVVYTEKEVLEVRRGGASIPWEWDIEKKLLTIDAKANFVEQHSLYTVTFID